MEEMELERMLCEKLPEKRKGEFANISCLGRFSFDDGC